jgi:3-hydroxybutyryl-CoA dehydrogenase
MVGSPDAVLATNTSSIPVTRIAQATLRPESVVGMHFFNPAPIMPLVEIVRTVISSDEAIVRGATFVGERLG